MKQHSKIVSVHSKFVAYLILIAFFEEHFLQQTPISLRQVVNHSPDVLLRLFLDQYTQGIDSPIRQMITVFLLQGSVA
jgi:hypothetical protein